MTPRAVGAVAAILLTLPSPLSANGRPGSALPVRIYNNVGISPEDLRIATREAEGILQAAGISVAWMECWHLDREPSGAPDECRRPLEGQALTLRLPAAAAVRPAKVMSMGYSLVQLRNQVPFLATVYSERVLSVARSANVDPRLLLGRAIAHEIGHLLLNTTRHAGTGLMRETWTVSELQRNDPVDWEFRAEDTQIMRVAVSARLSSAGQ
jgi:hypothetical protein